MNANYYKTALEFTKYYSQCRDGKIKSKKIFDFTAVASSEPIKDTFTLDMPSLSRRTYFDGLCERMSKHLMNGYTRVQVKEFFDSLAEDEKDEFFEIIQKLQLWRYEHKLIL